MEKVIKAVKKKSSRNKTIDFTLEEGKKYADRAIEVKDPVKLETIINQTILGDTFEVVKHLPEGFVDLMIADPPYNLTKTYHGKTFKETDADEYTAYTHRWLDAVLPLLSEKGSLYICCDWQTSMLIGPVLQEKMVIQNRITWQREKGRGAKRNWKNAMEDIWFASKTDDYKFNVDAVKVRRQVLAPYKTAGQPKDWEETVQGNFRDTYPSNFWDDITIPFWSMPENTAHPTQKPEKLMAKIILASSDEDDIVFDPFLGSGTTSVTAKKLGRRYVGIEHNPLYAAWCEKRLEMADEKPDIQGYADQVFWERNTRRFQKNN